ncbi:MAG: DUF971 domain-containing protein [Alphaproteobacteria bacterium]|jgi:DUF971 family protein|nr:DUF971 domain-containing protein [Alphaproteobacteria bacterium]MBT4020415.1 DUF971 domain-containing protein [Alphaproteobacteria bacterium]MBT5160636.1 DUF971 domain-containing protein [Alphaproteobacteria bacterium]MBT6387441.1 DUF971 domain-containing protein [Alphaproteobacteria bacterium]
MTDAAKKDTVSSPLEIRLKSEEKILEVDFPGGITYRFPAELLRVESPSAEVQGHGPGQKKTLPGRAHVGIMKVEPVGHYAVKLVFDDMHDTGIFTWDYFYELGPRIDQAWQDYLDALDKEGLSREP